MSKSFKHERTTGFLENAAKIRKSRQLKRELKAETINEVFDFDFNTDLDIQYAN